MTDPTYTAICALVDRSGSMATIQGAAEESINEFIREQRERPGRTTLRIAQFDAPLDWEDGVRGGPGWYLLHCPSVDPALVPRFVLAPRGRTALYDAMAKTIDEFGAELAELPEAQRPGCVIVAVLTDGKENASIAVADDVAQRVRRQQDDYGWTFLYLGANQDAILEAQKMGIPQHSSITYAATDGGTQAVTKSMGAVVAAAAAGEQAAFTDADRRRAMG